jgi:hypothetical protein
MDSPTPHLILAHEGPVPLDILEAFQAAVAVDGLAFRREARMGERASGSMTLLAFSGVGLFLTKAYFHDPLGALGPAHAPVLDSALRELGRRLMALPFRRPTTRDPAEVADRYSPVLSVWTERDADSRFKMLIPVDPSPASLDAALSTYLTFAQAYHTGALEPEDLEILAGVRPLAGVALLAYDDASGTIQPVDPFEGRGVVAR